MIKCKNCGVEVPQTSQRERYYCDDKCKAAYYRSIRNKSEVDSEQIHSEQAVFDSEHLIRNKHISGTCYGCGERQPSDLVDICHNCIAKGMTRKSLGLPKIKRASFHENKFIPNYKEIGIKPNKIFDYIAYCLEKSEKKIGNAVFVIKGRMFEIGKKFVEKEKLDIPPEFKA